MIVYLLLGILVVLAVVSSSPSFKGKAGEQAVRDVLKKLNPTEYQCLHDVLVRKSDGTTSQIDHVVVSLFGIFVIETKNYRGWIFGQESSQWWTQTIYRRKEKFFNPIWQNKGHVKALCQVLGNTEDQYLPIVAFSNRADLKVNSRSEVIHIRNLINTIQRYRQPIMTSAQVSDMVSKLTTLRIQDKQITRNHVEAVRQKKSIQELRVGQGICPACGGRLVERKGRYGPFVGCSNYPKCRYTMRV